MVKFNQPKRSYRKYIYSPLTFVILFLVLIALIKALWGVSLKERRSAEYLEREMADQSRVLKRKDELRQAVEYLKTERGIEAEIRSKFRVVKEGESVAVIVGDEAATTTKNRSASTTRSTWWKKLMDFFGP